MDLIEGVALLSAFGLQMLPLEGKVVVALWVGAQVIRSSAFALVLS